MDIDLDLPDWSKYGQAVCREVDPDLFFPAKWEDVWQTKQAKAICKNCPIKIPCLTYALERSDILGIWGGTTYLERARMRTERRKNARGNLGSDKRAS